MMDGQGGLEVMTYGADCHTVSYLLLNVFFGGLPGWVGADVDGTRLALAIVWHPVDRLEETEGETLFCFVFYQFDKCEATVLGPLKTAKKWPQNCVWECGILW